MLCLDNFTLDLLSNSKFPEIVPIALANLEKNDKELKEAKSNRNKVEYYFTLTPIFPLYLFQKYPEINLLSYVDADLYLFGDFYSLLNEMSKESVLLIEHGFDGSSPKHEMRGKYNVGFLAFRNDINSKKCLHWWREQCLRWCYDRYEDGKYADQKYLDEFPTRFKNVISSRNKGACVGPWNLFFSDISVDNGTFLFDGVQLIFFHFHATKVITSKIVEPRLNTPKIKWSSAMVRLYREYAKELTTIIQSESLPITCPARGYNDTSIELTLRDRLLTQRSFVRIGPFIIHVFLNRLTKRLLWLRDRMFRRVGGQVQ